MTHHDNRGLTPVLGSTSPPIKC